MREKVRYSICLRCKIFVSQLEYEYCGECGTRLIKRCPRCDKDFAAKDIKYCTNCGFDVFTP